ncbi:MAG: hypothetical protein M3119_08100 [Verrucomicrobiota bacterium]|nr:hypothetical protein [Verrucomicrobiota bacterium]MDQ6940101.1 hypothetical protein [Verrucomicrobiota bacterium]
MSDTPAFYFSLPRLLAKCCGRSAKRTQNNWLEANAAGIFLHVVFYAFAFRVFLSGHIILLQLLLLLPIAFLVWIFWLLLFYFDSLVIKGLRAMGFLRHLSDGSAQSILIGLVASACAVALALDRDGYKIIGEAWLTLVALNLLSAAILSLNVSATE